MKKIIYALIIIISASCKTTKVNSTGDTVKTWNTKHLDKIHKGPWKAGKSVIVPAEFKKKMETVKK